MSQSAKHLEAMRRNPAGDWKIDDVAAICRAFGLDFNAPSRRSHYDISHPAMTTILTIPARRPPAYIRALLAYVDAVEIDNHG